MSLIEVLALTASIWTVLVGGWSLVKAVLAILAARTTRFTIVRTERIQQLEACEEALKILVEQVEIAREPIHLGAERKMR